MHGHGVVQGRGWWATTDGSIPTRQPSGLVAALQEMSGCGGA